MTAFLNNDELWKHVFPEPSPFFELYGKRWVRYDEIRIEVKKGKTVVSFCWEGKPIYDLNVAELERGGVLNLIYINGISEMRI